MKNRRQILLLMLSDFKRINQFLFPPKSENLEIEVKLFT